MSCERNFEPSPKPTRLTSFSLASSVTDLTCDFEEIQVQGGNRHHLYQVHSGMLASAQRFTSSSSTVFATLKKALEDYPDYGLVISGHSLGKSSNFKFLLSNYGFLI